MLFPGATVHICTSRFSEQIRCKPTYSIDHLPSACPTRGKEFKLFQELIEFSREEKKWSNISTRRQQQVPQKNNHSFRAWSLEDSEFVFLPFFIRLRENLLLLLDFHLKRVGSTWCSNQWERDLKQNSVPFLAAGYVAFTIDFVLKAQRTFLEISIPVKIRSGKNVRKHGYSILSSVVIFFLLQNVIDGGCN